MSGWVKIHRQITEWEWYRDANTFRVFMHLLLSANYEDKRWRNIDVLRGQIITSRFDLAQALCLTERQVRTSLERLKMTGVISIKTTNQFSLISVKKYSLFQDTTNEDSQTKIQPATSKMSNERPTNDLPNVRPMTSRKSEKCLTNAQSATGKMSSERPTNDQPNVRPTTTTQEYNNNLKNKISSLHSDILSKSSDEQAPKKTFAELLKSKGIA